MPPCPLAGRPPAHTLLFDLDDTLYRVEEFPDLVRQRIEGEWVGRLWTFFSGGVGSPSLFSTHPHHTTPHHSTPDFMHTRMGVPLPDVPSLCQHFYTTYGTTLAGLVNTDLVPHAGPVFYREWHDAVHATLPYEELLRPEPALRALLTSLPARKKFIFTNADADHTATCLRLLGLDDAVFDGIICFESVQEAAEARGLVRHGVPVVCKPADVAITLALEAAGVPPSDTASVVFFDDSTRNLAAAMQAGVASVLVGRTGVEGVEAIAQIASLHDLPTTLPSLWTAHGVAPPPPRSQSAAALDAAAAVAAAGVESVSAVRNAVPAPRRRASLEGRRASLDSSGAGSPRVGVVPAR